uniref:Cytochrome c oxidase subunit 3 n=1 Tax=Ichneutes sp. QL-2013 TaxID=1421596 RepID=A0A0A6ZL22_9HYME|nr:cytochrome c oxidase subunit III [Ichneutes sp. QL-2013]
MKFNFPFHLVSESPWPLFGSLGLMNLMMGSLKFINESQLDLLICGNMMLIMVVCQWWRDVIRESTFQGLHLIKVKEGLSLGMLLFILFELMFFVSFFWGYFHLFLSPNIDLGMNFPPKNLLSFNPYNIPLMNTLILLFSGITITWGHFLIYLKNYNLSVKMVLMTLVLGMLFSFLQYLEYKESFFSISDSSYGSIFFLMTGFHGIHVIIGSLFICLTLMRLKSAHFSSYHHFSFEASSWYWHFVDVVWLFLYIFVYWLSY